MNTNLMFSSDKMDWATPEELYEALNKEFGFTVDVCASEWTPKDCFKEYDPRQGIEWWCKSEN